MNKILTVNNVTILRQGSIPGIASILTRGLYPYDTEYQMIQSISQEVINALSSKGYNCDITIKVDWNRRMRSNGGTAQYFRSSPSEIKLNARLHEKHNLEHLRQTFIHELCHIYAMHNRKHCIKPHGKEWQHLMTLCGVNPKRCHSMSTDGLSGVQRKWYVHCENKCKVYAVRIRQKKRIDNGEEIHHCKSCKGRMTVKEQFRGKGAKNVK